MKFDESGNRIGSRVINTSKHIGIVGSSKVYYKLAISLITDIVKSYPQDTIFISGGALGVDKATRIVCEQLGREFIEYLPSSRSWEGFKTRNLLIARNSDHIISIALPLKTTPCYHCGNSTHEKTAGCWTGKKCKSYEVRIL
jgi:hypothetical protein